MPGDQEPWQCIQGNFFGFILLSSLTAPAAAGPKNTTAALARTWQPPFGFCVCSPTKDAEAQMKLGFMYVTGEGTSQDYVEALN
jgi:TPR repeat protein